MRRSLASILAFLLLPLIASCQERIEKIHTKSTFAALGDYNPLNDYTLFAASEVDVNSKELISTSVRIKNVSTEAEATVQKNTLLPAIGWLDSSQVLLQAEISVEGHKLFGDWRGYLIRYNIFTQEQDTLPTPWYTSSNHIDNFLTASNRIFFTIAYGSEQMKTTYWIEYLVNTNKSKIIKQYKDESFSLLAYQYLLDTDEIIYIKGKGKRKEFIKLSLATGSEKIIKVLVSEDGIEESTAIINGKFYYITREFPKDNIGIQDFRNAKYLIKSLDITTGQLSHIYESEVEITKISPYKEGALLLSVQGNLGEGSVKKSIDFPSGDKVSIGLDFSSYLYVLNL
jgi:hypothetical protein